ncbi:MAG: hypothetical protein KHY83_01445 [Coriobacteriia bacterium]|nr:hypothetical protein [Coriobacteriia bacterium]MBS5477315.1 hypothetical protein [Coriobacteriia bacterium]
MGDEEGQMVVELAVVTPVMIVVAIVVLNLLFFMEDCARFDRLVPDIVMALAVAPSGEDVQAGNQAHRVSEALAQAMGDMRGIEVRVEEQNAWDAAQQEGTLGFSFAPHLTRYVCTMTYTPWPAVLTVAGVEAGIPVRLEHARTFTVDRYRSGVLF